MCAEYDPSRDHGHVTWRLQDEVPVVEIVNNWTCANFADTYRASSISVRVAQVLDAVQPHVLHVHSLLNLSFDLPSAARARGIPIVATLHDYSLVCASGGQRVHRADEHVCRSIDTERCARCFRESPFFAQAAFGRWSGAVRAPGRIRSAAVNLARRVPGAADVFQAVTTAAPGLAITAADIQERLKAAAAVFDLIDLFVAPSKSIASEFQRLGLPAHKIVVSDYGVPPLPPHSGTSNGGSHDRLRIGFVGTLVWHKGAHALLDAVHLLPADRFEVSVFGDRSVFPSYAASLTTRAAGLPVTFRGAFGRQEVAAAYRQMDVLVVPSLWIENSPLVIHEAFLAGVPVVGARIGGIEDLVTHDVTGLLYDPASTRALADALNRLIDDPQLLMRLSQNVRQSARVKSIADEALEWERVYDGLLTRADRRAPA